MQGGCLRGDSGEHFVTSTHVDPGFLAGGGEMGARIREFPWAETPLGEPRLWPQGLRTAVRILLTTQHPVFIFWGQHHICLYNDAYSRSLGPEKHPSRLGMPGRTAWPEIWPIIGPQIEYVMRGEGATWHENQLVPIIRHGSLQDVYWTYSYSPIDEPDAPRNVGGVLVVCTETTEQVLAQQRLTEERERFAQLFDQAPTFLALLEGPEHVFTYANPGYLKLVGHRAVIGRTVAEAIPETVEQGYVALLDDVYRTGNPFSALGAKFDMQAVPGGPIDERYVDFVYQPMTRGDGAVIGILVQGVDVTSRTRSDLALAQSRSRLDYATRLSGVGFWYCDLPFEELEWDERVKEHFFFPPAARITIDDFYARIHEEDRGPTRDAIDASIRNRTAYDIVYRTVHPDTGAIKWIRALGGTNYASDGTPTQFDGVTVDVTAQKLNEQRLSSLNNLLREQDRRKDEFIATLSHELRNPLGPIRAAARIIASPQTGPAARLQSQAIIERQVNQMSLLLDDLLDIARISQGRFQLRKAAVEVRDVVEGAVEELRPTLEGKDQRLSLRYPPEPCRVDADPLRLIQIIANLLMNASKYSDRGSPIELSVAVHADTLALSVKDQGIGIAAESLSEIFEIFSQVDTTSERSEGGLGIGLALVKGLAELHGGTIEARSEGLGCGSEFILQLPLAATAPLTPRVVAEPLPQAHKGRRILIADDNRDAADTLSMILAMEGHDVRVAYLGEQAVALAQEFRPDTALLDIGMPDMDGCEVARQLRREPWAGTLHLIALSGRGQEQDRRRAEQAGFDHHLVKPPDFDQLIARIALQ